MIHSSWFDKLLQWSAIPFVTLGLMAAGSLLPAGTRAQAQDTGYAACARDLLEVGIEAETAAAACALAFRPTQVSACVSGVLQVSAVTPEAALSACSRDRRPDEVATCVATIHDTLVVNDGQSVLDHCHRSLLPRRYAACVTGVADAVGYGVDEALSRCIAAGYRPENVAPTFIPME